MEMRIKGNCSDGNIERVMQHGPDECELNIIQACAIDHYVNAVRIFLEFGKKLISVIRLMRNSQPSPICLL